MSDSPSELVQQILGAAGEGIYGLDCQGRMTFANQASTDILGWEIDDCIGKSAHQVHHHSYADGSVYPNEKCPIYAAFQDGKVHRVEHEVFWHADGRAVPVEYTSTPIWENGNLNGAVVVFRDISERIEITKQREEAYAEISRLKEQLELERDYLRDEIRVIANFGEIIGNSTQLQRTLEQVEAVAQTNANVLVLGESGVGKEMIARAIHTHSPRADRALVKVNCASIPKDLFESEFFGHVKGAFTEHKNRVGRMQMANGGTLFLDEVAEIPVWLQSKLLRALQEHEFERVGDDKTVKVDLRVVAATNRDLEAEIKAGRFREDLFYRLSVFPIHVPPLRARKEDILPLTKHLLEHICGSMGREPLAVTQGQGELLQSLPWPGNIRELKNVLELAVILSKGSRLRLDLAVPGLDATTSNQQSGEPVSFLGTNFLTDDEFRNKEKQNLIAALGYAGWRISGKGGAADLLGIKPSTLAYRMKSLEIEKPAEG